MALPTVPTSLEPVSPLELHLPALDNGAGHSLERPILCDNAWRLSRDCVEAGEDRVEIAAHRLHLECERWVHGAGTCLEVVLGRSGAGWPTVSLR